MWKKYQVLSIFIFLGIVCGTYTMDTLGGKFIAPESVSKQWTIQSPSNDEFAGASQVGQGIAISNGALYLHQQMLYPSDRLILDTESLQGQFTGTMAPNGGTLALGIIGETEEYVFITPTTFHKDNLETVDAPIKEYRFSLELTQKGVFLEPDHIQLIDTPPSQLVLMTASKYTMLTSLALFDKDGKALFREDYTKQGRLPYAIVLGVLWGALMGWIAYALSTSFWNGIIRCSFVALPFFVLFQLSNHQWIEYIIRLYLIKTPIWDLFSYVFLGCTFFSLSYASIHAKVFTLKKSDQISYRWVVLWGACWLGGLILAPLTTFWRGAFIVLFFL